MKVPPELLSIFQKHLPAASVSYCISLWQKNPFHFHVKAPRSTKLGDFRFRRDQEIQTITINSDLNPFQFLLTYIHEVAHHLTFATYGPDHSPHGYEWKRTFQHLMDPMLNEQVFPRDILVPLKRYMKNPAASSARDLFLTKEMSKYDLSESTSAEKFLADLPTGQNFLLKGRRFTKKATRRTRVLCEEVASGRKFLVSTLAKVIPV